METSQISMDRQGYVTGYNLTLKNSCVGLSTGIDDVTDPEIRSNINPANYQIKQTLINGVYIKDDKSVTEAISDLVSLGFTFNDIVERSGVSVPYLIKCFEYLKLPMMIPKPIPSPPAPTTTTTTTTVIETTRKRTADEFSGDNDEAIFVKGPGMKMEEDGLFEHAQHDDDDHHHHHKRKMISGSLGSKVWLSQLVLEESSSEDENDTDGMGKNVLFMKRENSLKDKDVHETLKNNTKKIEELKRKIQEHKEKQRLQQQQQQDKVKEKEDNESLAKQSIKISIKDINESIITKQAFVQRIEGMAKDCYSRIQLHDDEIKKLKDRLETCQKALDKDKKAFSFYNKKITDMKTDIKDLNDEKIKREKLLLIEQNVNIEQHTPPVMEHQLIGVDKNVENRIKTDDQLLIAKNTPALLIAKNTPAAGMVVNKVVPNDNVIELPVEKDSELVGTSEISSISNGSRVEIPDPLIVSAEGDREDATNLGKKEKSLFSPFKSSLTAFKSYRFSPSFKSDAITSATWSNKIDYSKAFCPSETAGGRCNDSECTYQHFNSILVSELDIIQEIAKCFPDESKEAQNAYKKELKNYLISTNKGNGDNVSLLKSIIEFRNGKMSKDSFLDWLQFNKLSK